MIRNTVISTDRSNLVKKTNKPLPVTGLNYQISDKDNEEQFKVANQTYVYRSFYWMLSHSKIKEMEARVRQAKEGKKLILRKK